MFNIELCAATDDGTKNDYVNSAKTLGDIQEDSSSQNSSKSFVFGISEHFNSIGNFNFWFKELELFNYRDIVNYEMYRMSQITIELTNILKIFLKSELVPVVSH